MNSETSAADGATLIGVDWGTSNLRVLRIGEDGTVLATRSDPRGAGALGPEAFPTILAEVAQGWLDDGLPILACGMTGGRGKWREVAYLPAPATLTDLAASLASPEDRPDIRIVPGLKAMTDGRMINHRIVAPGTHSKWIAARPGQIRGYRTFMTGELFAAIRKGTIMGAGMGQPGVDAGAFADGVARALSDPALTAVLFSVRVETLADRLSPDAAADYLSGLLIGAEVAAQVADISSPVTLVGAEILNARYATALGIAGFSDIRVADGAAATARGLWRIHEASR